MPFITEKIYSKLYNNDESIMIAKYPEHRKELEFQSDEQKMEQIKEVITGIRNIRTKMNVHPSKKSKLIFVTKNYKNFIFEAENFIKKLGFAEEIIVKQERIGIPKNAVNIVTSEMEVFIPFEDLVDIKEEIERLEKEKLKILIEKEKTDKMLSNPGFLAKAPQVKVDEEKQKLIKFNDMINSIEERIKGLAQ
jgi:valyl-tRNA synthetase